MLGRVQALALTPPAITTGALIGTATEDQAAGGAQIDHVFYHDASTALLGEASALLGGNQFSVLSGGLAARQWLPEVKTIAGANLFYDWLQDSHGFSYSQMGLGGELIRGRYTLRANWYLPMGDRLGHKVTVSGADAASGEETGHDHVVSKQSRAMDAWDAELEIALLKQPKGFDPRVAVGWYGVRGYGADYSGARIRGEVQIGQYVHAGLEWRQDAAQIQQEWRGTVRFEFPLGKRVPVQNVLIPPPVRFTLPPVAARGDGKSIVRPERAAEKADGKKVRPLEKWDGKAVLPLAPAPEPSSEPEPAPASLLQPVKRTPWPNPLEFKEFCHCREVLSL